MSIKCILSTHTLEYTNILTVVRIINYFNVLVALLTKTLLGVMKLLWPQIRNQKPSEKRVGVRNISHLINVFICQISPPTLNCKHVSKCTCMVEKSISEYPTMNKV